MNKQRFFSVFSRMLLQSRRDWNHPAQRCRETATLGHDTTKFTNPERVGSGDAPISKAIQTDRNLKRWAEDATLSELRTFGDQRPRVARSSQPWAGRFNPVGIAEDLPTLTFGDRVSFHPKQRRIQQILVAVAFIVLSFSAAHAQFQQPPPQVSVSGAAEVKVAPDEVDISAGVETRDAQLDVATHQNDERVASALAFLKQAGVPDKDVQTDSIEVQPNYYNNGVEQIEPRFYEVRKSIQVKLTTVTNLEKIVTGLLNHGVNNLNSVDFRTAELRKYRDQARAMAVKAAKEKATALCTELDVKCGKPVSINAQEYGGYFGWPGNRWGGHGGGMYMNGVQNAVQNNGGGSDFPGETMSLGQISVSATVNVSFLIE